MTKYIYNGKEYNPTGVFGMAADYLCAMTFSGMMVGAAIGGVVGLAGAVLLPAVIVHAGIEIYKQSTQS